MMSDHQQQLVERYLSGAMSAPETREFLGRLEHDADLRRLVDADRVITGAVARERAAGIAGSTVPSESLMAVLAASSAAVATAPSGSSWLTSKLALMASAAGLSGIVVATIMMFSSGSNDGPKDASRPTAAPAVAAPAVAAPADPSATEAPALDVTAPAATSAVEQSDVDDQPNAGTPTPRVREEAARNAATAAPRTRETSVGSGATTLTRSREDERDPNELKEFNKGDVRMKVDVEQDETKNP